MLQKKCRTCDSFKKSHFCELNSPARAVLESSRKDLSFKKNQVIFKEGDTSHGLFCIYKGSVKLARIDENGNEFLLKIYTAGDSVGYRALFARELYQASAIAYEKTELCFIPWESLKKILELDVSLSLSLLQQMAHDIREFERRMANVVAKPVSQRVAEALLVLKKALPESKWTRREIAEWAGTTPETVIRTLAKFEKEGLIAQKGRSIHIQEREILKERARTDYLI